MRLGFDEWQSESFFFKCSCKRCRSETCKDSECEDCGHYLSGIWFKPPQPQLPTLHCGVFLRESCGLDSEFPGDACITTTIEPNHCYNLARLPCLNMLQAEPAICESPDIIAQNGGRKPCYKSMRTADFSCTPSWMTEAGRFIAGTNPYHPENQVP